LFAEVKMLGREVHQGRHFVYEAFYLFSVLKLCSTNLSDINIP